MSMELDTGAAVSVMSEDTYNQLWPHATLKQTSTQLKTYSGAPLPVVGQEQVDVRYEEQSAQLPLMVVKGGGPSLFGRDWLACLKLDWREIHRVQRSALEEVLQRHSSVFQEGLGTLQGYEAKIYVDPEAKPTFCKARPIPYAMKAKVEEELDRLVSEGVLDPV